MSKTKWCVYHKAEHPLSEFGTHASKPDGKQPWCRAARSEHQRSSKGRARQKRYRRTAKGRSVDARNRHRRRGAKGEIPADIYEVCIRDQKGKCFYCGDVLRFDKRRAVHVEHRTPVTKGGTNFRENLVLACHRCNDSKQNMNEYDWMMSGKYRKYILRRKAQGTLK